MSKSLKRNYIYNLFYQILTLITPLITAPYISRVLGPELIGQLSYAESIVSYFVLFATLGVTTYGVREIAYVQDDKEKRSEVFWNTKCLTLITTAVCLLFYIVFILIYRSNIKLFVLSAILILNVFLDITWFFQGLEEFGKIVLRNTIFRLLTLAYIFIFVHKAKDFYIYVAGLFGLQFISSISLWPLLNGYICKPKKIRPFKNIKIIISLFVPTIAISIYTVLDKTMIGIFAISSVENGFYEQALKLSKMVVTIVTALGVVVVPRIGAFVGKGDMDSVKTYMYRSYQFVLFLGIPLYLGLSTVSGNLVPWFFGNGYEKVIPLLRVLGILILSIGINNVTGLQYLIPTKRQNLFTFTVIVGAVINFVFNLVLIPRYYSIGAAIASVIAETVIALLQLFLVRNELSFGIVLKRSWKYFVSGIVMFLILFFIEKQLQPSIINTLILFIVGVISYFTVLLILRDKFFLENSKNVINKILKRKDD